MSRLIAAPRNIYARRPQPARDLATHNFGDDAEPRGFTGGLGQDAEAEKLFSTFILLFDQIMRIPISPY